VKRTLVDVVDVVRAATSNTSAEIGRHYRQTRHVWAHAESAGISVANVYGGLGQAQCSMPTSRWYAIVVDIGRARQHPRAREHQRYHRTTIRAARLRLSESNELIYTVRVAIVDVGVGLCVGGTRHVSNRNSVF